MAKKLFALVVSERRETRDSACSLLEALGLATFAAGCETEVTQLLAAEGAAWWPDLIVFAQEGAERPFSELAKLRPRELENVTTIVLPTFSAPRASCHLAAVANLVILVTALVRRKLPVGELTG